MSVLNLTPHAIHILDGCNNILSTIPASGKVARVDQMIDLVGLVDGLPLAKQFFSHPVMADGTHLPSPQEGVFLIVSGLLADALKGKRNDLLVPALQVRDEQGIVIGCRALSAP